MGISSSVLLAQAPSFLLMWAMNLSIRIAWAWNAHRRSYEPYATVQSHPSRCTRRRLACKMTPLHHPRDSAVGTLMHMRWSIKSRFSFMVLMFLWIEYTYTFSIINFKSWDGLPTLFSIDLCLSLSQIACLIGLFTFLRVLVLNNMVKALMLKETQDTHNS